MSLGDNKSFKIPALSTMINLHFVHSNLSNSAEDGFEKKAGFEDNLNLALNASAFDRLLLQNFQFSSEIFDILVITVQIFIFIFYSEYNKLQNGIYTTVI